MALEVSGAGEGAVAAGVGTGEPLLAGRSASSMRGGCVQGPRGSGLGVGGGVGVGVVKWVAMCMLRLWSSWKEALHAGNRQG